MKIIGGLRTAVKDHDTSPGPCVHRFFRQPEYECDVAGVSLQRYDAIVNIQSVEQQLSFRYVEAVANRTGYVATEPRQDFGVDLTLMHVEKVSRILKKNRYMCSGYSLDLQIKASRNLKLKNGKISYSLELKNYDDIRRRQLRGGTPIVLVVFVLPKDENDWLLLSKDEMRLRKCGYYYIPDGSETRMLCKAKLIIDQNNRITFQFFEELRKGMIRWN